MRAAALLLAAVFLALLVQPAVAAEPERVTREEAITAADRDPKVGDQERKNGELASVATLDEEDGNWEVAYFAAGDEVALVVVDGESGEVEESWTGHQVSWKMARGWAQASPSDLSAASAQASRSAMARRSTRTSSSAAIRASARASGYFPSPPWGCRRRI